LAFQPSIIIIEISLFNPGLRSIAFTASLADIAEHIKQWFMPGILFTSVMKISLLAILENLRLPDENGD